MGQSATSARHRLPKSHNRPQHLGVAHHRRSRNDPVQLERDRTLVVTTGRVGRRARLSYNGSFLLGYVLVVVTVGVFVVFVVRVRIVVVVDDAIVVLLAGGPS